MGDLISRQVVIETLCNHYEVNNAVQNATIDECIMLVKNIPSVDPLHAVKTLLNELEQTEETSEAEEISENPLAWTDGYEAWQDGYF